MSVHDSKDRLGAVLGNAGDAVQLSNPCLISIRHIAVDLIVQLRDVFVQFVDVLEYNANHFALKRRQDALKIVQQLFWICLQAGDNQLRQALPGDHFTPNQRIEDVAP